MQQIITQASIEDEKLGDNFSRQPAGGDGVRQAWSATTGGKRQSFSPEDPEKIISYKTMTETVAKVNSLMDKRTQNSSTDRDSNTMNHTVNCTLFSD